MLLNDEFVRRKLGRTSFHCSAWDEIYIAALFYTEYIDVQADG